MQSLSAVKSADFAESFEGCISVLNDFLGKYIRIGKVVKFFETFFSEPADIGTGLVAVENQFCPLSHRHSLETLT
jgi:hypothetical protein